MKPGMHADFSGGCFIAKAVEWRQAPARSQGSVSGRRDAGNPTTAPCTSIVLIQRLARWEQRPRRQTQGDGMSGTNDERNLSAGLAIKFDFVSMITPIFQSQDMGGEGLGEGVCRSVTQTWIAAHFDSVKFNDGHPITQWRNSVSLIQTAGRKYFLYVDDEFSSKTAKMPMDN